MGGQLCREVANDEQQFQSYVKSIAGEEFKPLVQKIQLKADRSKPIVLGNWEETAAEKTGRGIIYFPEKYYYEGDICNGVAQGAGKIIWSNKATYIGAVQNSKAEGQGELNCLLDSIKLKGTWVNGFPQLNKNFEMTRQGQTESINFVDYQNSELEQYFKKTIQVRVIYEGDLAFQKNTYKIEGEGTMKYPDGSYYQGRFQKGRMHGQGKYYWAKSGHWYEGQYKFNFRDGYGKYYFNERQFSEGEWNGGSLVVKPQFVPSKEQQIAKEEKASKPNQKSEPSN